MGKSHSPTIFVVFEGFWRFLLLQRHSVLLGWRLDREIYEEAINSTRNKRDLLAKIMFVTSYFINVDTFYLFLNWFSTRVRFSTRHGNPRKSWNLSISFSRPGKSWNLIVGPWSHGKLKLLSMARQRQCRIERSGHQSLCLLNCLRSKNTVKQGKESPKNFWKWQLN